MIVSHDSSSQDSKISQCNLEPNTVVAVPANFILPKNVSLANECTMLQNASVMFTVCQNASQVVRKYVGMTVREGVPRLVTQ